MKTLYWLRNDLRIHDNRSLLLACSDSTHLDLIFCQNKSLKQAGPARRNYTYQTLLALQESLGNLGQHLHLHSESILHFLNQNSQFDRIICTASYNSIGRAEEAEIEGWCRQNGKAFETVDQLPLYLKRQLPFEIGKLKSFTPFRKKIEAGPGPEECVPTPEQLPPPQLPEQMNFDLQSEPVENHEAGELAGFQRLDHYLWGSQAALTYKQTRNGMIEFDDSTKLSPFLALGSLSPRLVYHRLKKFEAEVTENESTYWIYFELLWRDFFKFYALKHGPALFSLRGPKDRELDWTQDLERNRHWHKWSKGKTGQDFVDANMRELYQTGWMSNRGRQNVASYWAKHIYCDWRLGARWFEKQLIDYDTESNWGNWAYNSGVGPDPRDRKFDLDRQAEMYDADRSYRDLFLK
ncbi:MAG: DASH family cryptochrome [Bdellovibrionales bacterium]|nr:DASH family cryptochrome [Bdellovibrionales bacterium]